MWPVCRSVAAQWRAPSFLAIARILAILSRLAGWIRRDCLNMCLNSDARKAFQNFDRSAIWGIVDELFPELSAYVRLLYGVESCILLRDAGLEDPVVVLNAVGARQGDPLGTWLYALAQQPIHGQKKLEAKTWRVKSQLLLLLLLLCFFKKCDTRNETLKYTH